MQRYLEEVTTWTDGTVDSDSMAGSFDFNMRAGMLYLVYLYGSAATTGGGTATVYLDPTFKFGASIDSTGLTLSVSEGVLASPLPKPATGFLLALGLAGLARQQPLGTTST